MCIRDDFGERQENPGHLPRVRADHVASGSVIELDAQSLAVRRRWVVGVYPDGIDFGD